MQLQTAVQLGARKFHSKVKKVSTGYRCNQVTVEFHQGTVNPHKVLICTRYNKC